MLENLLVRFLPDVCLGESATEEFSKEFAWWNSAKSTARRFHHAGLGGGDRGAKPSGRPLLSVCISTPPGPILWVSVFK
jgi:hypothetical protein